MNKNLELVKFNLTPSMSLELLKFNNFKKELNELRKLYNLDKDDKLLLKINKLEKNLVESRKTFIREFRINNKDEILKYLMLKDEKENVD